MALAVVSEREVERAVVAVYRAFSCEVWRLSGKTRGRRTTADAGVPDLWVMRIGHGGWWHEVKRPGGQQSAEQIAFMEQCRRAGVDYVLGGYEEAKAQLRARGLMLT